MAAFRRASDQWTPVYDQFGNFRFWLHRETQERRYINNPPRQPLAFPPMAFEGAPNPSSAIGPHLHFVARPPAEGFPPPLGWKVEFHSPALEVREPAAGRGWTPPAMSGIGPLPFPPNNFTRPSPCPRMRKKQPSPKPSTNEAEQWFLQSNKKGEKYYLNTTTGEWQFETPDCLKKYTTR